jgi:glycosyltransferase 2 family protein
MRRTLPRILLLIVVLLIVGFLIYHSRGAIQLSGFSWEKLKESVRHARYSLLLLGIAALFATFAIRSLRWQRLSRYLDRANFGNIYRCTMIGFTAIFLLGRAADPLRPILIARKDKVPISNTFGIYLMERLFDAASTAVLAGLSLLIFPSRVAAQNGSASLMAAARSTGIVLMAGLGAAVAFLVYFRLHGAAALGRRLEKWHSGSRGQRKLAVLLTGLSDGLQSIRSWSDLFAAIGYSTAHWSLVTLIYLLVMRSFGGRLGEIGFSGAMLLLAFTMVGSAVQVPMVGGGSQAASFIAFTQVFGVEKEPAAAASIVLWLVTFAASSLVGVPLLIHEGWSMGELKRIARAEKEAESAGEHIPDAKENDSKRPQSDGATK